MRTYNFTLRQLQYVVAVAEMLSFRGAAELCNVSQPSLSAQVADIEAALGVPLFERDRRGVLVTVAGQEIISRARRVLLEADDFVEAAHRFVDPLAGTLRLGVIPTIGPYLLPRVVPALRKAYPRMMLIWIEDKTEVLVRSVGTANSMRLSWLWKPTSEISSTTCSLSILLCWPHRQTINSAGARNR